MILHKKKDFAKILIYHANMIVYIEVVVINNLCIDALLIVSTLLIKHTKLHKIRILLVSIFGTVVATAYLFMPIWLQIVSKVLLAPTMILLLGVGKKQYLSTLIVFVALTFLLGGTIYGINNLIGVDIKGYLVLGLVSFGVLIVEIFVVYLLKNLSKAKKKIADVDIVIFGKLYHARAFYDTGNTLVDDYSGKPVVIISQELKTKINALECLKAEMFEGFISVKTISKDDSLPLVNLDYIVVDGKKICAMGALSNSNFDDCDLILQNTMF